MASLQEVNNELREIDSQLRILQTRRRGLLQLKQVLVASSAAEIDLDSTTEWSSTFRWTKHLRQIAANQFGISSFRFLQEEIMNASLSCKHTFVVMPTVSSG